MRVVFRKWGDRPHWEYDALRLGDDEHGTWIGAVAGTRLQRPGAEFNALGDFVSLVPHDAPFVATFYDSVWAAAETGVDVYVDITTVPRTPWTTRIRSGAVSRGGMKSTSRTVPSGASNSVSRTSVSGR